MGLPEHVQVMDLTLEVLEQENRTMHYLEIYERIKHRTMAKSSSIISLASQITKWLSQRLDI